MDLVKGTFSTISNEGKVVSPWVHVGNNIKAIDALYVKVNDVIEGTMKYFNVRVRTADSDAGMNQMDIYYEKRTNLVEIRPGSLREYIQVEVEMSTDRVINSLEVYAKFVENENPPHITPNPSGYLLTKVYNTVIPASYKPKYMTGSITRADQVLVYVRGCRRDKNNEVWTGWYKCDIEGEMIFKTNCHTFENYQYFQFKIELRDEDASIRIEDFIFEVVE